MIGHFNAKVSYNYNLFFNWWIEYNFVFLQKTLNISILKMTNY